MAHRDHGHDHYAPAPQACRQPCCSNSSLMALCGQDEGGPWWSASGWYAASRRHGFVDSLDGEEATSHTRGEASSLSVVRTRSARALPILGTRGSIILQLPSNIEPGRHHRLRYINTCTAGKGHDDGNSTSKTSSSPLQTTITPPEHNTRTRAGDLIPRPTIPARLIGCAG